jgi:hypothetical protein
MPRLAGAPTDVDRGLQVPGRPGQAFVARPTVLAPADVATLRMLAERAATMKGGPAAVSAWRGVLGGRVMSGKDACEFAARAQTIVVDGAEGVPVGTLAMLAESLRGLGSRAGAELLRPMWALALADPCYRGINAEVGGWLGRAAMCASPELEESVFAVAQKLAGANSPVSKAMVSVYDLHCDTQKPVPPDYTERAAADAASARQALHAAAVAGAGFGPAVQPPDVVLRERQPGVSMARHLRALVAGSETTRRSGGSLPCFVARAGRWPVPKGPGDTPTQPRTSSAAAAALLSESVPIMTEQPKGKKQRDAVVVGSFVRAVLPTLAYTRRGFPHLDASVSRPGMFGVVDAILFVSPVTGEANHLPAHAGAPAPSGHLVQIRVGPRWFIYEPTAWQRVHVATARDLVGWRYPFGVLLCDCPVASITAAEVAFYDQIFAHLVIVADADADATAPAPAPAPAADEGVAMEA